MQILTTEGMEKIWEGAIIYFIFKLLCGNVCYPQENLSIINFWLTSEIVLQWLWLWLWLVSKLKYISFFLFFFHQLWPTPCCEHITWPTDTDTNHPSQSPTCAVLGLFFCIDVMIVESIQPWILLIAQTFPKGIIKSLSAQGVPICFGGNIK